MVNANDPVESFLNSFQVVRDVFLPFESGLRKAVKDLEYSWAVSKPAYNSLQGGVRASNKNQICSVKKKSCCFVHGDKKKGLRRKVPVKALLGIFPHNCGSNINKIGKLGKGSEEEDSNENDSCSNCLQFPVRWSLFPNGFLHSFSNPFKPSKKHVRKNGGGNNDYVYTCANTSKSCISREAKWGSRCQETILKQDNVTKISIERLFGFICDQLILNFQKFDLGVHSRNNHLRDVSCTLEEKRTEIIGLLGNLGFARVGGLPPSIIGIASAKEEDNSNIVVGEKEDSGGSSPSKLANGLLSIPLSNVERLRSTLSTVSLTELIELVPQLGRSPKDYPDKKKLFSVQDFFRYTEAEGRRFFEELDRDDDGQVTLEDLEVVMTKRKLPRRYAREFLQRTRNHLFSRSFGWKQFLSLMEQKESTILRAYTSLCLSKSGTLKKSEILESLKNAGLPANEDNAIAMMRFLNADTEESISYGHFRNFMVLLPFDRLQEDPRSIWFEAATVVAVPPPVDIPASSVLKSALAGGLSCALSCSVLYPVDTMKTRVQASTLTFPEIISKLPQIGIQGLYKGSVPAILGQFSSHGLRTGIFEASKLVLVNVAPTLPELQVQSIASFCSTLLGTAVRIPCEVLKQRLQAGLFDNVGEAIVGTWNQDGLKGFFRGTGATLFREVPFYVAGMGLYAESKKGVQHLLGRELEPWETIAVGAISGGFAAVVTTPFDVMKTRMMTAPGGRSVSMQMVAISILRREGPLGLFKGAVPRFFWIAPLGAMNFAGYELAKKAMEKNEEQQAADQLLQKG